MDSDDESVDITTTVKGPGASSATATPDPHKRRKARCAPPTYPQPVRAGHKRAQELFGHLIVVVYLGTLIGDIHRKSIVSTRTSKSDNRVAHSPPLRAARCAVRATVLSH